MGKNRLRWNEAWESKEQTQGKAYHLGGATEGGHGMSIFMKLEGRLHT